MYWEVTAQGIQPIHSRQGKYNTINQLFFSCLLQVPANTLETDTLAPTPTPQFEPDPCVAISSQFFIHADRVS
jgi:hypothetical protein